MRRTSWEDVLNKKYNRLTPVEIVATGPKTKLKCICDCGNEKIVVGINLIYGLTKSCGCLHKEHARNHAKNMGQKNRKYEEICTFCGKPEHYSIGLCKNCYIRYKRNGTLEKRPLKIKHRIVINKKQEERVLYLVKTNKNNLIKDKILYNQTIDKWLNKNKVRRKSLIPKIYDYLKLDVYEDLELNPKFMNNKTIFKSEGY